MSALIFKLLKRPCNRRIFLASIAMLGLLSFSISHLGSGSSQDNNESNVVYIKSMELEVLEDVKDMSMEMYVKRKLDLLKEAIQDLTNRKTQLMDHNALFLKQKQQIGKNWSKYHVTSPR